MRPFIDDTGFGWIKIDGKLYEYDVVISLDGKIEKRKKKLSKNVYGTSHRISIDEAESVYQDGADLLILGTGQTGFVKLSQEAGQFFRDRSCESILLPTPEAVRIWNADSGKTIGLFHVTC